MESSNKSDSGIKVFAVGQMRCGTASLKKALEYLYKGKCYHMDEVIDNPLHIELWQKCCNENSLSKNRAAEIFKGYIGALDNPAVAFYKDISKIYPNAKIILNVRDANSWVESVIETTLFVPKSSLIERCALYLYGYNKFKNMCDALVERGLGRPVEILMEKTVLKDCFIEYNKKVKEFFKHKDILVFTAADGWGPLCKFLNKEIPDIPYPFVNSKKEFRAIRNKRLKSHLFKILVSIYVLGIAILYIFMNETNI